jgi:diacylglycerol O-acyltransferase / wax synthase
MTAGVVAPNRAVVRPPLWRELVIGLLVFAVYVIVASLEGPGRRNAAEAHARSLFDFETTLHLDVEPAMNHWLAPHHIVSTLANYEYATTYVISAFVLLFWVYARRPAVYRWARNSFIVLNLAAVTCFAFYPLMPPRLVPGQEFVDTVTVHHTFGSWGSPLVSQANQLAAMPSLHFGWALWVSVVLAYIAGGWRTQVVSAVHVLVTLWVIMATGNHYLLDAVAGAALAWAAVSVTGRFGGRDAPVGRPVPAADAFFLYVEKAEAPQHVGGVIVLDTTGRPRGSPSVAEVVSLVRDRLDRLPGFRQRLAAPARWRRPRWVPHDELDWAWHVTEFDATAPGRPAGPAALDEIVAEIAEQALPRDRPLWRIAVVHGVAPDRAAIVVVLHHVIADGIGTVTQVMHLLDPPLRLPVSDRRPVPRWKTVLGVVVGLAQLATDGRARDRLPVARSHRRAFSTITLHLDEVREVARAHRVRVTDLLLYLVAAATQAALAPAHPRRLRVAVPLTVRDISTAAEGNATAAVIADVPLDGSTGSAWLAEIAAGTRRLRTGTRTVASRFVMQAAGVVLPVPVHRRFARAVYGPAYFHGIVSNLPGAQEQFSLAGAPIDVAYPLLPLAPGTGFAVGALGWNGQLCIGLTVHPAQLPDLTTFTAGAISAYDELRAVVSPPAIDVPAVVPPARPAASPSREQA